MNNLTLSMCEVRTNTAQVCVQIGKRLIEISVDFSVHDDEIEIYRLINIETSFILWEYGESCGLIDILHDEIVSQIKEISDE